MEVFVKMCRLCACEKPKLSVNMFSEIGKRHQLPDKIRLCLPITIYEDDKLPKEICTTCLYKIEMCHELYNTSFTAQNILKSKLDNLMFEDPKFLEDKCDGIGTAGDVINEGLKMNPQLHNLQDAKKTQRDTPIRENKTVHFEQINSPVIPRDVHVRLTSDKSSHNASRPPETNLVGFDKHIDMETEIPGIIVTDITGAPLAPIRSEDGVMPWDKSPSSDTTLIEVTADYKRKEPSTSKRLTSSTDKIGKRDHSDGSSAESDVEIQEPKNENSQLRVNLNPVARKKSTGVVGVKCKYCLKWFSKNNIDHHTRLHLKEKVYSCVECGKNFKSEISLSMHDCGQ